MSLIEEAYPDLQGVLPKNYQELDDRLLINSIKTLINEFKHRFPDISLESNMAYLVWFRYAGLGLGIKEVEKILHKYLRENKYFKVWRRS